MYDLLISQRDYSICIQYTNSVILLVVKLFVAYYHTYIGAFNLGIHEDEIKNCKHCLQPIDGNSLQFKTAQISGCYGRVRPSSKCS